MKKYYIEIDGDSFILVLMDNELFLFERKDGQLQLVSISETKDKNEMIQNSVKALLKTIEEEISEKLKNGEFNSIDEIIAELDDRIKNINIPQFKTLLKDVDFKSYDEYKLVIKHLSEKFKEMDKDEKKEMLENELNVDLRTLFAENGIKEYEVTPSKSVITYEKDGEMHTLINTDPNSNIYDVVFNSIEFDKLTSRKEIDAEISRIIDLERQHKYHENQNVDYNNLEQDKKAIADFLEREYGYTNIKGINPDDKSVIEDGWIVELSDGSKIPIFATKDADGNLSVTFGKEKQVNSSTAPETEMKTIDNDKLDIQNEITGETLEQQFLEIVGRVIYENEELSPEDIEFLESYRNNKEEFNKLPDDAKEMCEDLLNAHYDLEKSNSKEAGGRQYKLEPPKSNHSSSDESGIVYVGIVTFLSGVITGIFVYLFYRMFI